LQVLQGSFSLDLASPFDGLASAGLMPARAKPRSRVLDEDQLPQWYQAIQHLGERHKCYLMLLLLTGLRKNEARNLKCSDVDFSQKFILIRETKSGRQHSLPLSIHLERLLAPICLKLEPLDELFHGVSADHVSKMAQRQGSPRFLLHDFRKIIATTGQRIGLSDAVMRRVLNHAPPRSDVMHRHYVELNISDISAPLERIQDF